MISVDTSSAERRDSREREMITVRSPASGQRLGEVPVFTADEVKAVVQRARKAQSAWGALPVEETCRLLDELPALLDDAERQGDLPTARLLSAVRVLFESDTQPDCAGRPVSEWPAFHLDLIVDATQGETAGQVDSPDADAPARFAALLYELLGGPHRGDGARPPLAALGEPANRTLQRALPRMHTQRSPARAPGSTRLRNSCKPAPGGAARPGSMRWRACWTPRSNAGRRGAATIPKRAPCCEPSSAYAKSCGSSDFARPRASATRTSRHKMRACAAARHRPRTHRSIQAVRGLCDLPLACRGSGSSASP